MNNRVYIGTLLCVLGLSGGALRAADNVSTVSASGTATLQKPPTAMRVVYTLSVSGKDTAEAVKKLGQARTDLKAKLAPLQPVEGSLHISEPSSGSGAGLSEKQQQMQMLMAMGRGGKKPPVVTTVTVSATVKAAFSLSAESSDELLVKARELEDKLRAALGSSAEPATKPATPEEQEIAEEMATQQQEVPGMPKPGEPQFTYVFTVSDEDAIKLTADALAKAKADATVLASAAGMKLSTIWQLTSGPAATAQENAYSSYINSLTQAMAPAHDEGVREAVGTEPGGVKYEVNVTATFALLP